MPLGDACSFLNGYFSPPNQRNSTGDEVIKKLVVFYNFLV